MKKEGLNKQRTKQGGSLGKKAVISNKDLKIRANFPNKSILKSALIIVIMIIGIASFSKITIADSASLTNDQDLYFTGTSSDPSTLYQDAIDSNSDVGIQICDVGQKYVGAFYAADISGTWNYVLVSYSSSSNALGFTSNDDGSGCYSTNAGFITISPSKLTTPDPDVYKAALPGKLWVGYAASANPGTISNFIFGGSNARLLGDYTMQRSFTQSTRQITIQTPTITFTTSSGSFSKSGSDSDFGINDDRRLVLAVCDDQEGSSCSDGGIISSSSIFPVSYDSGLSASQINDQSIYTKYIVSNGIAKDICIGANLQASVLSLTPDPVYYSQNLTISYKISNPRNTPYEITGGNVEVTTNFDIKITIYNASDSSDVIYTTTIPITTDLVPDGYTSGQLTWPAYAHSGTYTVKVEADINDDIVECSETDNYDTRNFELKPITIPDVYIDGVSSREFPYPNIPYNLSFHFKNSDNITLNNATVIITERNGLSLMAPTQIYNMTVDSSNNTQKSGLVTENKVTFYTDYYGNASFTFIPTYNLLYNPRYNYTDLQEYIGTHYLSLTGTQNDGEGFKFVINGELSSTMNFTITNTTYNGSYNQKTLIHENMASQVMDFIYQTFTNFLKTIVGG